MQQLNGPFLTQEKYETMSSLWIMSAVFMVASQPPRQVGPKQQQQQQQQHQQQKKQANLLLNSAHFGRQQLAMR